MSKGTRHDDVIKLAKAKRSRKNLDSIRELVEELQGAGERANEVAEQLDSLYELTDDSESLEQNLREAADDHELFSAGWVDEVMSCIKRLGQLLPAREDEQSFHGLADAVSSLADACDEYEGSLEDRDYSAEDREELWENITESLTAIGYIFEDKEKENTA